MLFPLASSRSFGNEDIDFPHEQQTHSSWRHHGMEQILGAATVLVSTELVLGGWSMSRVVPLSSWF